MMTKNLLSAGSFVLLFLLSTSAQAVGFPGPGPKHGPAAVLQSAEMLDYVTGVPVAGGGVLQRTRSEVSGRLSTSGLDPSTAYSVWWVIFNRPQNCSGPCGEDDLILESGELNEAGIEATAAAVFYADGFVTGPDGVANVTAHLQAGRLPMGTDVLFGKGLRPGNGLRAEIHMVIRSHGPAFPGVVGFQTSTFAGHCDVNVCEDHQAIVFPPAF